MLKENQVMLDQLTETQKVLREVNGSPVPKAGRGRGKKLIGVCRASGMPLVFEHFDLFKQEYGTAYDKVTKKLGIQGTKLITAEMQARSARLLNRIEKFLLKKYPDKGAWPEIRTIKEWEEKVKQYGPIAIAMSEAGDLTYVILDVPIN